VCFKGVEMMLMMCEGINGKQKERKVEHFSPQVVNPSSTEYIYVFICIYMYLYVYLCIYMYLYKYRSVCIYPPWKACTLLLLMMITLTYINCNSQSL